MKQHPSLGIFVSFTFLLFTSMVSEALSEWITYRVVAGQHDFTPNDFPAPYFNADTYIASFAFDASCWWGIDDEDYTGNRDIYDWNKLGGMTNYFNANSTHSVLLAWRPAAEPDLMEIVAYINPKSGRFVSGPELTWPVGEPLNNARIEWQADSVHFEYGTVRFSHALERPWAIRKVGPWFGGNQTAHRDMELRMESDLE